MERRTGEWYRCKLEGLKESCSWKGRSARFEVLKKGQPFWSRQAASRPLSRWIENPGAMCDVHGVASQPRRNGGARRAATLGQRETKNREREGRTAGTGIEINMDGNQGLASDKYTTRGACERVSRHTSTGVRWALPWPRPGQLENCSRDRKIVNGS